MAAGLKETGTANRRRNLLVLEVATGTNAPPSGASAGVPTNGSDWAEFFGGQWEARSVSLLVYSSAGSATMTCQIRMWGYDSVSARWYPLAYVAGGATIAELSDDSIRHAEKFDDLFDWDRIYAEVTAIGGTSTAINVALRLPIHAN